MGMLVLTPRFSRNLSDVTSSLVNKRVLVLGNGMNWESSEPHHANHANPEKMKVSFIGLKDLQD
jgi:hypothetical protein